MTSPYSRVCLLLSSLGIRSEWLDVTAHKTQTALLDAQQSDILMGEKALAIKDFYMLTALLA